MWIALALLLTLFIVINILLCVRKSRELGNHKVIGLLVFDLVYLLVCLILVLHNIQK